MSYTRKADITADLAAATTLDIHAKMVADDDYGFVHKGILISTATTQAVKDIVGILADEPSASVAKTYSLMSNQVHDLVFRSITKAGTTTDTILIVGINI